MATKTTPFDASEYLDSPEMIREYLKAAFEGGDAELLAIALGNVAKAQGMTEIARKTHLSRQNLYRALTPGASPKFDTIKKVVEAFGMKLTIA
jgi:probable addiction module antidote protein